MTASTYTAIGFVQALMGKLEQATESLHRSLSLKRDDIVTSALLKFCLDDLMEETALPDNNILLDSEMKSLLMQTAGGTKMAGGGGRNQTFEGSAAATASFDGDRKAFLNRMKIKLAYDDSPNSGGGGGVSGSGGGAGGDDGSEIIDNSDMSLEYWLRLLIIWLRKIKTMIN